MNSTDQIQAVCERCDTPLERGDLRCSICGQSTPRDLGDRKAISVQILRCTGCGAAVAYDPQKQAPVCSFCHSVMKVETIEDPMEQTEAYLPFTVSREEARRALRQWLGSLGWFRPDDLKSAARLEELKPLWWVAWVFDAEAWVSWTADSNAGNRRSAWAPHAGQTQVNFHQIVASASRGLSGAEVDAIVPGLVLSDTRDEPEGAENATLEQFDLQRSQARQQVSGALRYMAQQHIERTQIPGTSYRNVNVSVVVRKLVTRRLSLPAYVLAYRYKQELYRVVVCGQDTSRIIGKAPYSMAKVALVVVLAVVGGLALLGMFAAMS